jgi:hypothetical protein
MHAEWSVATAAQPDAVGGGQHRNGAADQGGFEREQDRLPMNRAGRASAIPEHRRRFAGNATRRLSGPGPHTPYRSAREPSTRRTDD